MAKNIKIFDDRRMNVEPTAAYLGLSIKTLAIKRMRRNRNQNLSNWARTWMTGCRSLRVTSTEELKHSKTLDGHVRNCIYNYGRQVGVTNRITPQKSDGCHQKDALRAAIGAKPPSGEGKSAAPSHSDRARSFAMKRRMCGSPEWNLVKFEPPGRSETRRDRINTR